MDCQNSCTLTLPWVWVFEMLTSSSQVDTSLLLDLLKKIPDISDDNCKKARELVSLRILECLNAQKGRAHSVASREKVRINPSEHCEDVLLRILSETSISDLKAAGAEMLKWDILPFVAHKRSSLINCSLVKLKNAILSRSHPSLVSLRKHSSLPVGDQPENQTPTVDGDRNGTIIRLDGSNVDSRKRKFAPENYLYYGNSPAKRKGIVHAEDAKENPCKDLIIYEWGVADRTDAAATKNDLNLLVSTSKNIEQCGQRGRCSSRKKTRVGVTEPPRDSDIGCTSSKRLVAPHGGLTCEKRARHHGTRVQNEKFDEEHAQDRDNVDAECDKGLHESQSMNEEMEKLDRDIERNGPNVHEVEEIDTSSDSDRYCEEISDIAAKKNEVLNSQCTLNSLVIDSTELNLCIKCQNDGNLLVCCSDSCPLVIHENCLGFNATFDKDGKFYCPYCVYFRAVSMYKETKEKAAYSIKKMKERVSLARNDFVVAFCSGTTKGTEKQPHRSSSIRQNHLAQHDSLYKSNELNTIDAAKKVDISKLKKMMEKRNGFRFNPLRGQEIGSSTHEIPHTSREEMKRTCEVSPSLGVRDHHQRAAPEIRVSLGGKGICQVSDSSDGHLKTISKNRVSCRPETHSTPESKSIQSADAGKTSKDGRNHISYPARPQLRRRRPPRPWTSAEIEKLKEAVQALYNPQGGTFPWRRILEFGAGTFDKSRTPVDLKDKWRNICRATE